MSENEPKESKKRTITEELEVGGSQLVERVQDIIAGFTNFISLIFWGVVAWAAYKITIEKGILEVTDDFLIPYRPFRFIFAFGLLLLALAFLIEMVKAMKRGLKR